MNCDILINFQLVKMKKVIPVLLLIFILSIILYWYFLGYAFWQSISISGIGTFKVPEKWIITQMENVIYITDRPIDNEEYKIILFGVIRTESDRKNDYDFFNYKLFESVVHIETIDYGVVYSNNARYWVEKYKINGHSEKKYILLFFNSNRDINLIVWDNQIKKNTIIKIVKSFTTAMENL